MINDADMGQIVQRLQPIIQQLIDDAMSSPLPIFTVSSHPDATDKRWLWRPFVLTDGAGNKWVVISNGTTLRYLEGTAV